VEEAEHPMWQLAGIVVGVILLCVAGAARERPGSISRVAGWLLVAIGGAMTGSVIMLVLTLMLWPGACVAVLCPNCYRAPAPDELWRAGATYYVLLGGLGGLLPLAAFRLGYGGAVLGVVVTTRGGWGGDGGDAVLVLLGVIAWALVSGLVRAVGRWVGAGAHDSLPAGAHHASPAGASDFWDGTGWRSA
jgi:hypothetical protein